MLVFLNSRLVCRLEVRNCFSFLPQQSVGSLNVLENDLIIVRELLELGAFQEELKYDGRISGSEEHTDGGRERLASYFSPGLEPDINLRDKS